MFGVRDQWQEGENRKRVRPPEQTARLPAVHKGSQVGEHEQKDQQRYDPRLGRERPQPFRTDHKSAKGQSSDPDGHGDSEDGGKVEIEPVEKPGAIEKTESDSIGEMVERD